MAEASLHLWAVLYDSRRVLYVDQSVSMYIGGNFCLYKKTEVSVHSCFPLTHDYASWHIGTLDRFCMFCISWCRRVYVSTIFFCNL